jgi:hypothetical protein
LVERKNVEREKIRGKISKEKMQERKNVEIENYKRK